jgi:hypothetical protein
MWDSHGTHSGHNTGSTTVERRAVLHVNVRSNVGPTRDPHRPQHRANSDRRLGSLLVKRRPNAGQTSGRTRPHAGPTSGARWPQQRANNDQTSDRTRAPHRTLGGRTSSRRLVKGRAYTSCNAAPTTGDAPVKHRPTPVKCRSNTASVVVNPPLREIPRSRECLRPRGASESV